MVFYHATLGQRPAVYQRVDGEYLCCFEVSNDRQMAVRANGRGQPGTAGARREQRGSTQPRTVETQHCYDDGGERNVAIRKSNALVCTRRV